MSINVTYEGQKLDLVFHSKQYYRLSAMVDICGGFWARRWLISADIAGFSAIIHYESVAERPL